MPEAEEGAVQRLRTVEIRVRLPDDIARQAEEVARDDPEFLSRVVLYGLTRRSIYRHLREVQDEAVEAMRRHVFPELETDDE